MTLLQQDVFVTRSIIKVANCLQSFRKIDVKKFDISKSSLIISFWQ